MKKERWKDAETDSTTALQLDNTYVKAYQRRALAREKLNQVGEAISDTKKVLEFEPHNKESKVVLERLEKLMETQPKPTVSILLVTNMMYWIFYYYMILIQIYSYHNSRAAGHPNLKSSLISYGPSAC